MSFDSREFRNALGRFATGVCVITANPKGHKPFGMTVNSFSSLSLEPALIQWNLQLNSECAPAFEACEGFTVNILGLDQQDLSNQYAKKGAHDIPEGDYRLGKSGNPVLKGCLTSFECKVWARYDGGDHVILIGEVVEMDDSPTGDPLLFYSGKYRELR